MGTNLSTFENASFLGVRPLLFLCRYKSKTAENMWLKMMFRYFSESKKIAYLKENGIMLGTRHRNGRKVYLYMVKDFFVEVTYQRDDIDLEPEKLETFSSLDNLNAYLEKEFRAAF